MPNIDRYNNDEAESIARKIRAWTPTVHYPYGVEPVFYFDHPIGPLIEEIRRLQRESYQAGFEQGQTAMKQTLDMIGKVI